MKTLRTLALIIMLAYISLSSHPALSLGTTPSELGKPLADDKVPCELARHFDISKVPSQLASSLATNKTSANNTAPSDPRKPLTINSASTNDTTPTLREYIPSKAGSTLAISQAPSNETTPLLWKPASYDLRRALPNNTTPPERKNPLTELEPLDSIEGVIRRVRIPPSSDAKPVALTFDMCELDTATTGCDMDVINFLRERQIPATLFMGGKWMRTHSRRVKQIMTEPIFEIANHNWSHGNCALLSPEGLKAQILWTQSQYELLHEEACPDDVPEVPLLFRLPYGRNNERSLKIIASLGLRVIQWDVAAESGADNTNPKRAKRSANRVVSMTRPGSILLFHANGVPKGTAVLLREVVSELEAQGYTFVKVSELLAMGEPETVRSGYFSSPGDNLILDRKFGIDGTGRRSLFTGE